MIEHLNQTKNHLQNRVQENLRFIKENNQKIQKLLKEAVSDSRSARIDEIREVNKKYLKENEEAIRIQHGINNFLIHYRHNLKEEEDLRVAVAPENTRSDEKATGKEESFKKTISGELPYNKNHPYFGDEGFKSMLLDHYIALEDYETCAWLMQQDNK